MNQRAGRGKGQVQPRVRPREQEQHHCTPDDAGSGGAPGADGPEVYLQACELAVATGQHVFDTLYHAVALLTPECTLVTADERYYERAHKAGSIALLRDFDPAKTEYRR